MDDGSWEGSGDGGSVELGATRVSMCQAFDLDASSGRTRVRPENLTDTKRASFIAVGSWEPLGSPFIQEKANAEAAGVPDRPARGGRFVATGLRCQATMNQLHKQLGFVRRSFRLCSRWANAARVGPGLLLVAGDHRARLVPRFSRQRDDVSESARRIAAERHRGAGAGVERIHVVVAVHLPAGAKRRAARLHRGGDGV